MTVDTTVPPLGGAGSKSLHSWFSGFCARLRSRGELHAIMRELEAECSSRREPTGTLLHDDGSLRIVMTAFDAARGLPVHDHPGSRGLFCVFSGSVEAQHLDLLHGSPLSRTAVLIERCRSRLRTGEIDWFGLRRRNLHALRAEHGIATVLSARRYGPSAAPPQAFTVVNERYLEQPGLLLALRVPRANRPGIVLS